MKNQTLSNRNFYSNFLPGLVLLVSGSAAVAGPLIYEAFDYPVGVLVDNSPWIASNGASNLEVVEPSLGYGDLPVSGGRAVPLGRSEISLNEGVTTLKDAGLLNDGQTLWMSILLQPKVGANANTVIRIGTDPVSPFSQIEGGTGDSVGFHVQNGSDIQVRYHHDGALTNAGNIINNATLDETHFIVAEMIWNSDNSQPDTLNYYVPDQSLNLGSPIRTVDSATFDQGEFDLFTIGVSSSNSTLVDEIRMGASYEDVITSTVSPPTGPLILNIGQAGSGPGFELTWASQAGINYDLFSSSNLDDWDLVQASIPGEESGINLLEVTPSENTLFYRVEISGSTPQN